MKPNTLFGVTLWLMLMATVGTGAINAKDDTNPRQAGQSSIYLYDVAASDSHGKGKLMVDLNQGTFVFNGQDFEPSVQITLHARAAGSDSYDLFAIGSTTPSGNLHISGMWQAGTAAAEVVADAYYPPIEAFRLENVGWFVAQVACYYSTDDGVTWHESDHSGDITINHYKFVYLDDLGVPLGAWVKIHVIVIAGKDRTGSEIYRYMGYGGGACYEIWGTTMNPTLAIEY